MELLRFVRPYRKQFTIGSVAKLVEAMLELYLPILMARIIDVGIPNVDRAFILRTGLHILILALVGYGCAVTCQYFAAVTSQGTGTIIRDAVIDKISTLSFRELDYFGTSTLINRLTSDVNYIQQAVAMTMRLVTRTPFLCIGAVILSVSIDSRLALVFAVVIPLLTLVVYLLFKATAPLYRGVQKKLDLFALIIRENLSGIQVIRAFARTDRERQRTHDAADELSDAYVHVSGLSALLNPATSMILNMGIIALLYFGAGRVFSGQLSQGDLLAMTTYATKILYALLVMANLVVLFTKASVSSARLAELLDTEATVTDPAAPCTVAADKNTPAVRFENVSFAYSESENALTDLRFSLTRGKILGIVGATGSGKTTVIDLIQRFYDPTAGRVLIGGVPAREYTQAQLRSIIGVVPQRNTLFSGSISDNLRWGKEDATEAEMVAALKTAQCWDFVSALPGGIHNAIHEGGKNLSGGQKQRLCIARAVVKRPQLLILDDSLSALDYQTDLRLRRALAADLAGTTVIIVSQRISSVVSADSILVLHDGRMEGMGTHSQLLESCMTYREIYESQTDGGKGGNASA